MTNLEIDSSQLDNAISIIETLAKAGRPEYLAWAVEWLHHAWGSLGAMPWPLVRVRGGPCSSVIPWGCELVLDRGVVDSFGKRLESK
jgi:hypothetical protein